MMHHLGGGRVHDTIAMRSQSQSQVNVLEVGRKVSLIHSVDQVPCITANEKPLAAAIVDVAHFIVDH